MAGRSKLPDVHTLVGLVDDGLTHQQIADRYDVTRQAVTIKLRGAIDQRNWRRDWPWQVESRHKTGYLYDGLAYYLADKRKDRILPKREKDILDSFLSQLHSVERRSGMSLVVDYDPNTPVGFYFRERKETDPEDSIIGQAA